MRQLRRNPFRMNADKPISTKQRKLNDIGYVHTRRFIDEANTATIIWVGMNAKMRLTEAMQKPRDLGPLRIKRIQRQETVKLNHDNPKATKNHRPRIEQVAILGPFNVNLQNQITRHRRRAIHLYPLIKPEAVGVAVDIQPLLVKRLQLRNQRCLEALDITGKITHMARDPISQRELILKALVVINPRRKAVRDPIEIIWNQVGPI